MLAAVDIGGTKITVSIANTKGLQVKVFQNVCLKGDEKTIPRQVDNLIHQACQNININEKDIQAVGISTCSPFTKKGNFREITAPNLCGGLKRLQKEIPNDWQGIPLEEELSKKYALVKMENDCVSAVVAERLFGAAKEQNNVIYVTWSTGIGCGAYVDGNLIKGKNGNAPHLGPIYMVDQDLQSGNKDYFYLEALASGTAIARNYGVGKKTENVFADYKLDSKAKAIIDNAVHHFVQGLISINYLLDTDIIVLGGSVFLNNQDVLLPMIKDKFYKESFSVFSDGVEIVPSALGDYLGDMAALSLIIPDNWIEDWQKNLFWTNAPPAIVL